MMTKFLVKNQYVRSRFLFFFTLFLCFVIMGCGVHRNSETGPPHRSHTKKIVIPLFANATFEPNLEKELTRIFKTVFSRNGWDLENHAADDRLTLSGKIIGFSQRPTALTPTGGARAYQIKIDVEVRLKKPEEGTPFVKTISGRSDYIAQADAVAERAAKDRAIREAVEKIAQQVAALIQHSIQKQSQVTVK
ncbi:MAG: LPS assembly lipoprotein LptE [Nitrospiria bacterium]